MIDINKQSIVDKEKKNDGSVFTEGSEVISDIWTKVEWNEKRVYIFGWLGSANRAARRLS